MDEETHSYRIFGRRKRKRKRKKAQLDRPSNRTLTVILGKSVNSMILLISLFLLSAISITPCKSEMRAEHWHIESNEITEVRRSAAVQHQQSSHSLPPASKCLFKDKFQQDKHLNSSKLIGHIRWASSQFNQLIQSTQNSVIPRFNINLTSIGATPRQVIDVETPNDIDSDSPSRQSQWSFESICSGWRNIQLLPAQSKASNDQPPAFWSYDQARQALVAKFIFYDRSEFLDISARIALLTSPKFPPIPAYHSQQGSRYYSSCILTFSSYMTISSHLELNIVLPPIQSPKTNLQHLKQQSQPQTHSHPQSQSESQSQSQSQAQPNTGEVTASLHNQIHSIKTIIEGKMGKSRVIAEKVSEKAAWIQHEIVMPFDMPPNLAYRLEFSAMSGMITSDTLGGSKFLSGVAIKNISLSPQCFGLEIDEQQMDQLSSSGYFSGTYWSLPDLQSGNETRELGQTDNRQRKNLALFWLLLESYKFHIFLAVALIIFFIVSCSNYSIICWKIIGSQGSGKLAARSKLAFWPNWLRLGLCYCCPCCILPLILTDRKRRYRIYMSDKQLDETPLRYKTESDHKSRQRGKRQTLNDDRQRDSSESLHKSLFPFHQMLEDVELNENPQYKSSLFALALNQPHPLEAYEIDKKRLTLTRLLGKGAFGQVYQGYLVCYNSGDTDDRDNSSYASSNFNEHHEEGAKSDRELRRFRRLEYGDCNSSKEQLDSHSIPVAVKALTENGMKKVDFILEATSMSMVSHRNIVGFIGVCFEDEPKYIIMEYLAGGNLKNFLLKNRRRVPQSQLRPPSIHSPASPTGYDSFGKDRSRQQQQSAWTSQPNLNTFSTGLAKQTDRSSLNVGDLLVAALDIARACDYLQKRKIIHRDLAARNCLLTSSSKDQHSKFSSRNSNSASPTTIERSFSGAKFLSTFSASSQSGSINQSPSAHRVDAKSQLDLSRVYLNGFEDSGIVTKLADFGMTREIEQQSDYYRTTRREMPGKLRYETIDYYFEVPIEVSNGLNQSFSSMDATRMLEWSCNE